MTINTTRTTRELADGNEMPMPGLAAGLKPQTELVAAELTDEQLATLRSYGTTEQTSVGQVLATADQDACGAWPEPESVNGVVS